MKKTSIALLLCTVSLAVKAQTRPVAASVQGQPASPKETEPYGKIEMSDLEMKSCDFEPDANAEILFDKGVITPESGLQMERHIRIKIFNDFGKSAGSIRIEYPSYNHTVVIADLQAETINLNNGKIEVTPLDKKGAYTENVDKRYSALVFAMPNVKAGSVIEYKYRATLQYFPTWYFQNNFPTRYSEMRMDLPNAAEFRGVPHVYQQFVKNVGESTDLRQIKALANIRSLPDELYMGSRNDNLERMEYLNMNTLGSTWNKIGDLLLRYTDFGYELRRSIPSADAGAITSQAKSLKTVDEKVELIFDYVKTKMKWNEITAFNTSEEGTLNAWDKKTGNSAEINIILYQLLKKAGVKSYPMVASTKKNGKINPANPNALLFNNTVVYIPVDSTKLYVLDASNKFNLYNTIPADVLNSFGLSIDENNKEYKMVFLQNDEPAMQSVFLNAEITPQGKMNGTAEITSYSYNKTNAAEKYTTGGEEKYIKYLLNDDNNLKIRAIKMENMEVDSLPLTQKVDFSTDLTGSDENYIYFNSNFFTLMGANPFVSENRYSDIDFGFRKNYSISGIYKLPAGFKTDAVPKSVTIVMPDQSIIFKRTVVEDNGTILVRYVLNHKKTIYFRNDYDDIRGFYKKMHELLAEQIVLKKS